MPKPVNIRYIFMTIKNNKNYYYNYKIKIIFVILF